MFRRTIVIATVLLFNLSGAWAQGMIFFEGPWSEVLDKAKKENKLIFVDAYAAWCGPCKAMAKNVFPDPKAGAFYNANFINLKIDMEKPENREFASKYPVRSYPTFLFIDHEGKVVAKEIGGRDVDAFVEMGRKALGKNDKSGDFEQQYKDGKRDPEFLFAYVKALNQGGKPSLAITNEYLNTQKDLTTPFNLRFILEGATESDSRVFGLLLTHRNAIAALEGTEAVDRRIENACNATLNKAVQFSNKELLAEARSNMKKGLPAKAKAFGLEADMRFYQEQKNAAEYLKAAQALQKSEIKNNSAKLHELSVNMLRAFPKDKKVMAQAEKWVKKAAETGGLPEYYMTLANIYKAQGKKEEARKAAKNALELNGDKDKNIKSRIEMFIRSLD